MQRECEEDFDFLFLCAELVVVAQVVKEETDKKRVECW